MIRVPEFPLPGLTKFLIELVKDNDRTLTGYLTNNTANHSVLLQSPMGKVFEVTVDEAGVLTTTRKA